MQQSLFNNEIQKTQDGTEETSLILSKLMSNKSKEKAAFQKVLEKNKQLQSRLTFVEMLSAFSVEKIHELLTKTEGEFGQLLLTEVRKLDECAQNRLFKFTRTRKEKLQEIIFEKAVNAYHEFGVTEAKDFVDIYKPEQYDEDMSEMKTEMANKLKEELGIDFDMDDFDGEMDFEKLEEKYGENMKEFQRKMEDGEMHFGTYRKKTKSEIRRDEKRKADEKLLENDVQKLFKELVLKLHPDKEINDALKEEKERLLKLVNKARDEEDIYELLRIRMLVADTDNSMQELVWNQDTLKRLTKLIKEKNKMLEDNIFRIHHETPPLNLVPAIVMDETKMKQSIFHLIEQRKNDLITEMVSRTTEIRMFSKNNKSINEYIDQYRFEINDDLFDDLFGDLFDDDDF
jgi:hypothetical protein